MNQNNGPEDGVSEIFRRTERSLMATIESAIELAGSDLERELQSIGLKYGTPSEDHYYRVALHILFLRLCGADTETSIGGDPKRASRLLHVGRKIARLWEGKNLSQEGTVSEMTAEDKRDRRELAEAAGRLALRSAVRTLIDHASKSDPGLRDRLQATIEHSIARGDPKSEAAEVFAEFARASVLSLIRPSGSE
jgi:hypothetical protein